MSNYLGRYSNKQSLRKKSGKPRNQSATGISTPNREKIASQLQQPRSEIHTLSHQRTQKKRALTSRRIAVLISLAIHVIGAFAATIYIVKRTVFDQEFVQATIMEAQDKPQVKRRTRVHVAQRPNKPQPLPPNKVKLHQSLTTDARIPGGNARTAIPAGNISIAPVSGLSGGALDRKMFTVNRQAKVAAVTAKFAPPQFASTSVIGRIDVGTSASQVDFTPDALEPMTADLSHAKQSFSEFLKTIREQIKRAQRRLPSVREAIEGTAKVRFTIRRNGGVAGVKVVTSSGSRSLDAAAIAAVRDAAPFPPFPEDQKGAILHVEIPIVFQLKTG